ncbi:MAG: CvpA family protein [Lachnospiraceae bacterium]|nr:CvpA family protein [Lachnospiraceae bacterium]
MTRTFWILIIIGIFVWGYCIKKGSERGLIQELNTVLTLICATACYRLAAGLAANYSKGNVSSALVGILLLVVVASAFGIFHLIFSSIHIFSRLPVIRILDNILGVFGGFVEGAVVLYLADTLLRYFVAV